MIKLTLYGNDRLAKNYKKEVPQGFEATDIEFVVPENTFFSEVSKVEANKKAELYADTEGPIYANNNGKYAPKVWKNKAITKFYIKDDCPENMPCGEVPVIAHEGQFVSTISQEDADSKALDYITSIGQSYANTYGKCKRPYYSRRFSEVFYKNDCEKGMEDPDGIVYVFKAGEIVSDISQKDADERARALFLDLGQKKANEESSCAEVFYSDKQEGYFRNSKCGKGFKGKSIYYKIDAEEFHSFISKEDANEQAKAALEEQGQKYANEYGDCTEDLLWVRGNCKPVSGGTIEGLGSYKRYDYCRLQILPSGDFSLTSLKINKEDTVLDDNLSIEFQVLDNCYVEAKFESNLLYTIEAQVSDPDGGSVLGGGEYRKGEECSLNVVVNDGYNFGGWYKDGILVSMSKNYVVYVTEASQGTYVARLNPR